MIKQQWRRSGSHARAGSISQRIGSGKGKAGSRQRARTNTATRLWRSTKELSGKDFSTISAATGRGGAGGGLAPISEQQQEVREGWLWKQGEIFKTWRRRWFVAERDPDTADSLTLSYYTSATKESKKGTISLKVRVHVKLCRFCPPFRIHTHTHTHTHTHITLADQGRGEIRFTVHTIMTMK